MRKPILTKYLKQKPGFFNGPTVPSNLPDSMLILACAQGNLDLVNIQLPLGADPTVQVTEEETLLEYIGEDWSQLGFTFPMVLPDWSTDKDTEILQALQAYVSSP